MRLKSLSMGAAVAALVLAGSTVSARPGGPGGPGGPGLPPPPPPGDTSGPGHVGPGDGLHVHAIAGGYLAPFWRADAVAAALELTEDQATALETSLRTALEALQAQEGFVASARAALSEALRAEENGVEPADHEDLVLAALDALKTAETERETIILKHAVAVQGILTAEQEAKLAELRAGALPPPPPPGELGDKAIAGDSRGGTPPPPPPGDLSRIMQEIMPLVHEALADCDLTDDEKAAIAAKIASLNLPPDLAARVAQMVEAGIQHILADCVPVDPDEVDAAIADLTALVETLAVDGLTWEEIRQIREALAALPYPVQHAVAPVIHDMIRQILEDQGGVDDRPRIDEATRAAFQAVVALVKELAQDEDGLTEADIAVIEAAIAKYDEAIAAVIGPRIKAIIDRIVANQSECDGPADQNRGSSGSGLGDGGAGAPPPSRPAPSEPAGPKRLR